MLEHNDAIVEIPENRVKFFGGHGKMLLPSPATVAAVLQRIPEHKLITTDLLRKELGEQFEVEGVCPVTTKKALKAIADDTDENVAYWRVVNQTGSLISIFPGGVEGHAALLQKEGFAIDAQGKAPKVKHFKQSLVHFN